MDNDRIWKLNGLVTLNGLVLFWTSCVDNVE